MNYKSGLHNNILYIGNQKKKMRKIKHKKYFNLHNISFAVCRHISIPHSLPQINLPDLQQCSSDVEVDGGLAKTTRTG